MKRHYDDIVDESTANKSDGTFDQYMRRYREATRREPSNLATMTRRYNQQRSAAVLVVQHELWQPYRSLADDPRFRQVVKTIDPKVTGVTAHILYHAAALRRTRRFYRVTKALAERLHRTELRGLRTNDVRLPYPAIYIEVPPGDLRVWNDQTAWHRLTGIYVSEELDDERNWQILACGESKGELVPGMPDDAVVYWKMQLPDDLGLDEAIALSATQDMTEVDHPQAQQAIAQFKRQEWRSIFRWILNLVMYATSVDARVEIDQASQKAWRDRQQHKSKAKREAAAVRWRRLGHTMVVGRGLEPMKGHELRVRTMVTGHWRNVAYGPGLRDHRSRWIEPYFRGPVDAPLTETQHLL